ncbi:MAG: hypothetical protein M1823_003409 [Watsoniomyces obsoletus]|nr:MAG: hypothetical protein M1823_003409 [Watsoniomyces obsoletus]
MELCERVYACRNDVKIKEYDYRPTKEQWNDAKKTYHQLFKRTKPRVGALRQDPVFSSSKVKRPMDLLNLDEDEEVVDIHRLQCLLVLLSQPVPYLPPSTIMERLPHHHFAVARDVQMIRQDAGLRDELWVLSEGSLTQPSSRWGRLACSALEAMLDMQGVEVTKTFLDVLDTQLDSHGDKLQDALQDARTHDLASVMTAFENVCVQYPVETPKECPDVRFLVKYVGLLNKDPMRVLKRSATMLPSTRQPRLLTYVLEAWARLAEDSSLLESFLDYLVEQFQKDKDCSGSSALRHMVSSMAAYALVDMECAFAFGVPGNAYRRLRTAFIRTKYGAVFDETIEQTNFDKALSEVLQINKNHWLHANQAAVDEDDLVRGVANL